MKELMESSYLSVMSEQNDKLREEIKHLQSVIDKAIDKLICWGEVLDVDFQKQMLEILRSKE